MEDRLKTGFSHYCFDMDGTLIDSCKTIYDAMIHTLDRLDIKYSIDEEMFIPKIGQHFKEIFEAFGVDIPDFDKYLSIYKQIYMDEIGKSKLYNGVYDVLDNLKTRGARISLLTTKAQDQAERIVDYFGLKKYFDLVMGRRDGIAHKPSSEPLIKICEELSVQVNKTLMVGDTELDIQCGKNAGSFTCAVLYGYRIVELIVKENPDFIINDLSGILDLRVK